MSTPAPSTATRRVLRAARASIVLLALALVALVGRVVQLQTRPPSPLVPRIGLQGSSRPLTGRRGNLLDRHGRILAASCIATRLFADPKLIQDPDIFAQILADTLGYDSAQVAKQIDARRHRRYVPIDHRIVDQRLEMLSDVRLRGLATQPWMVRVYPQGVHAGQVLGCVGFEGKGIEGLEFAFDQELSGVTGTYATIRDVRFRPLRIDPHSYRAPNDGHSIRLTLDLEIQSIAEQELQHQCERYLAQSGQLIVIDPRDGALLAMANFPFSNPHELDETKQEHRRNKCVTDAFEPGSVFKSFVWAMATDIGVARPGEMIDCTTSGVWRSAKGRRLRDVRGHGRITWEQVLIKSSNIGMATIGQRLGTRRLYEAITAFGFGRRSGSELPGESPGIVNPLSRWNHYSVTSVPMGQEVAVTGVQLVRALCAIANDGVLPRPTIRNDQVSYGIDQRVISAEAARYTRHVMRRVVLEGTGRKANSDQYSIFGKTGTAQVPDPENGGYEVDQYVASFIGGAPVEEPRLVVGCFVHRPDKSKGHYGGIVAAPAVRRVIERSLRYLAVAQTAN